MVLRRGFEEAVKDDQDFVFDPAWSPTESWRWISGRWDSFRKPSFSSSECFTSRCPCNAQAVLSPAGLPPPFEKATVPIMPRDSVLRGQSMSISWLRKSIYIYFLYISLYIYVVFSCFLRLSPPAQYSHLNCLGGTCYCKIRISYDDMVCVDRWWWCVSFDKACTQQQWWEGQ